jgi:hypothetical protein
LRRADAPVHGAVAYFWFLPQQLCDAFHEQRLIPSRQWCSGTVDNINFTLSQL